jgi:hypothetical protein
MLISDCKNFPKVNELTNKLREFLNQKYISWDTIINNYELDYFDNYITANKNVQSIMPTNVTYPVLWLHYKLNVNQIVNDFNVYDMFNVLNNQWNCIYSTDSCDYDTLGKYVFLISIIVNYRDEINSKILNEHYTDLRINFILYFLRQYRKIGFESKHLYFRGQFIQDFLKKTFKNFLSVTSENLDYLINENSKQINDWIDYKYSKAGEDSRTVAGTTLAQIKGINEIKFFMKILPNNDPSKTTDFVREFLVSTAINNLRNLVPNYMICYGAFFCNSNEDMSELCSSKNNSYSYILLENIENADTMYKTFTKNFDILNNESQIIDIIYQIMACLTIGWKEINFTHYDFHSNNIMISNILENQNDTIFFDYYIDNIKYTVPVKYLCVIIDYGTSYVNNCVQCANYQSDNYLKDTIYNNRPSRIYDIYTFFSQLFITILELKPLLLLEKDNNNNYTFRNQIMSNLFYVFFKSFNILFKNGFETLLSRILQFVSDNNGSLYLKEEELKSLYYYEMKNEYTIQYPYIYFINGVKDQDVEKPFNSTQNILNYMKELYYDKYYFKQNKLKEIKEYRLFNWGYLPDGIERGEDHGTYIENLEQLRKNNKNEKIRQLDIFEKTNRK